MKNILVTGGAGYIGSVLIRKLLSAGYNVVCVDKLAFGGESLIDVWSHPNFLFYKLDINDYVKISDVLRKHPVSAIIHLAAIVGDPACSIEPELAVKTNWEASRYILENSIELKTPRFIFASTCSNYGKMRDPNGYVDENSPLSPISLYAELKVKFENYMLNEIALTEGFCPVALRFSTVYGLSNRPRFDLTVNEFTKELSLGRELIVFGEQFWRPYCHVDDFSRAILLILDAPRNKIAYEVFNVGDSSENYTKKMIVEEICKQISGCKIKYVEKKEDPRDYKVNFDKIKKTLGFRISKTVPDGIREIREIIENGLISNPDNQRFYNVPFQAGRR